MIDYNELINNSLQTMKLTKTDFIKLHGESNFIRVNLENGSLVIEIHNKETEEICGECNE